MYEGGECCALTLWYVSGRYLAWITRMKLKSFCEGILNSTSRLFSCKGKAMRRADILGGGGAPNRIGRQGVHQG